MLKIFLLSAALAAVTADQDQEEQKPQDDTESQAEEQEPLTYQETVVVTAANEPQELIDASSLVTAFTAEALERSPALVIDDTLRRVPGFSLFRRSSSLYSHPTTQGVSLRGIGPSGASRSLVLWNGIPLNDPFGNWVYWNRLPATSNRSAEIARGATSQLYGSSALGGTIQLIPRPPEERTLDARLQLGNRGTYDADIFASHRSGHWAWIASGRVFDTDGYIPVTETNDEGERLRGDVDEPMKTKFQTFLGRLEYRDFHVGVNIYDEKRNNGTQAQRNDSQILLVETGYDTDTWSFNFYGQKQELASTFSRVLPGRHREISFAETRFPSVGFGSSFSMRTPIGIQWGLDWRYVSWDPDDDIDGNNETQNFAGTFAQYVFTFGDRIDLLVGGRFDVYQNTTTKGTFNHRAGVTFRATDNAAVRASVYRGFRAPSLNELYRPFRVGNVVTTANDGLIAEYLWGGEIGVDFYPTRDVLVRLNAFYNRLLDAVANRTLCVGPDPVDGADCAGNPVGTILRQRQNIGIATVAGFEASVNYNFARVWTARASYLFSNAINDDTDLRLPQVANNQASLGIGYDGPFGFDGPFGIGYDGRLQFTADLRLVGDAFEDDLNDIVLPNYALFDLSVRVPVAPKLQIYVAIENLLDEDYAVRADPLPLLGPPRRVHGGIELRVFN